MMQHIVLEGGPVDGLPLWCRGGSFVYDGRTRYVETERRDLAGRVVYELASPQIETAPIETRPRRDPAAELCKGT